MIASDRRAAGGIFFAVTETVLEEIQRCRPTIHCFNELATHCLFELNGSLNSLMYSIQCNAGSSYLLDADEMKRLMVLKSPKLVYTQGFVICENCGYNEYINCDYIRDRRIDVFVRLLETMRIYIVDKKIIGCRKCHGYT